MIFGSLSDIRGGGPGNQYLNHGDAWQLGAWLKRIRKGFFSGCHWAI